MTRRPGEEPHADAGRGRCFVHQSELIQNNTVVVQGRDGVLVIDAGITGSEMVCLANDLRELGQPVVAGFATHPDWDHVLWHDDLGDAPRYGTARCATFMQDLRSKPDWKAGVTDGLPEEIADEIPLDPFGLITGLPPETAQLPWEGPDVRIIEHPAHAPGHAALLIGERGVLAAGDMLSDLFVPMLDVEGSADPIGVDVQLRERIELDRAYVLALRDGRDPADPRVTSPKPGWEWVSDVHHGQAQHFA